MNFFDNLSKMEVVFSSCEVEDLEATARILLEVTSWMDLWAYAAKFFAPSNQSNPAKV